MIAAPPPQAVHAARTTLHKIEQLVEHCRKLAPREAALAEDAAVLLQKGGHFYVAGEPGFIAEASGRAGGLMMTRSAGGPAPLPPGSVLVYGWREGSRLGADAPWLASTRAAGSEVIGMGPSMPPSPLRQSFSEVLPGLGLDPALTAGGRSFGNLDAIGNTVNLWSFTGEMVAALSRRHLTPSVWQSIWVTGARERNAPRSGHDYDPLLTIRPIPPLTMARAYTTSLLSSLHGLEKSVPDFVAAAEALDRARRSGHHARLYIMAHMVGQEIRGGDDPDLLDPLPDPLPDSAVGHPIEPGDEVLALGYTGISDDVAHAAESAGAPVTWFVAPTPRMSLPARQDRLIDARWRPGDAAVSLPGYDVGALPPSGVLQLAAYWTVTSAMLALGTEPGILSSGIR